MIQEILSVFERFRMPALPIDEYESTGRQKLETMITGFVSRKQPLSFVMLGFPMKSMNDRDKVLGKLPDLGEQLAIDNFGSFNEQVKQVYSQGIDMNIINDGYAFNDLMEISDRTVAEYEEITKDMSLGKPIKIFDMKDFYQGKIRRDKLENQFGITAEELDRRIMMDADVNMLYKGMIRFMMGDIAIRNYDSNNQLHKAAKRLAREMMLRNEAYSALVKSEFSDKIRLSMHPSVNNGTKYSFQLIPGAHNTMSPWHCAIFRDGNMYHTIHKKDAIGAGYQIQNVDGRPYYFSN